MSKRLDHPQECYNPAADPFAATPDATPADFETRRKWGVEPERCDLVGKRKRKKTDLNPHQRRWFERNGYTYARVEHTNAYGSVTVDLWSFGDYLAVRGDETLIVQTCPHSAAATREAKARKAPELAAWLAGRDRRFQVHGWRQPGGAGTRWEVVIREVTL